MSSAEQLLGGYWFLHSLFFASFIFYVAIKILKNRWLCASLLLASTFMLLILDLHIPFFGVGPREFLGAFFMAAGCAYKHFDLKVENNYWIILVSIIILIIGTHYWQCGMLYLTWQKVIPYSISAIAGTLMVFSISNLILKSKVLSSILIYVGDHTLEILTWHFLSFKVISLLLIWLQHLPIEQLAEFPVIEEYAYGGWWMPYSLIGVCLPLLGVMCVSLLKKNN